MSDHSRTSTPERTGLAIAMISLVAEMMQVFPESKNAVLHIAPRVLFISGVLALVLAWIARVLLGDRNRARWDGLDIRRWPRTLRPLVLLVGDATRSAIALVASWKFWFAIITLVLVLLRTWIIFDSHQSRVIDSNQWGTASAAPILQPSSSPPVHSLEQHRTEYLVFGLTAWAILLAVGFGSAALVVTMRDRRPLAIIEREISDTLERYVSKQTPSSLWKQVLSEDSGDIYAIAVNGWDLISGVRSEGDGHPAGVSELEQTLQRLNDSRKIHLLIADPMSRAISIRNFILNWKMREYYLRPFVIIILLLDKHHSGRPGGRLHVRKYSSFPSLRAIASSLRVVVQRYTVFAHGRDYPPKMFWRVIRYTDHINGRSRPEDGVRDPVIKGHPDSLYEAFYIKMIENWNDESSVLVKPISAWGTAELRHLAIRCGACPRWRKKDTWPKEEWIQRICETLDLSEVRARLAEA